MVSIAISFFVMILAVAISSGFRHSLRDGVSSITGDIRITDADMNVTGEDNAICQNLSIEKEILDIKGVEKISPVVMRAGVVSSGGLVHGILVKGVESADSSLTVSVPRRLATILSLGVGDSMVTYFIGEKVKVRRFKVGNIYDSLVQMDDELIVYAPISDMRRLNQWDEDEASALEITLDSRHRSRKRLNDCSGRVGTMLLTSSDEGEQELVCSSAVNSFPQIFDWLDLLDFNVAVILILMTVVAGFNMISGLLILLFRNIPTIGLLKTLGMRDRSIGKVFVRVASNIVLKGMLIGNAFAVLFCAVQGMTHLIKLNPENYFVPYVPVHLNVPGIIAADLLAYSAIVALLLIPTLFISKVDPAETVRVN